MLKEKKAHQDTQTKSSKKKIKFANIFGFLKIKLNKNSKRKKNDKSNEYFEEDQQKPSSVAPQQFSDEDLIEQELMVDSLSKSSASASTSEISLEKPKEKLYMKKLFKFSRKYTVNSSSSSVNSSNSEQNDSAYETETENCLKEKEKEKEKKMRKTRMTTLSENDKEYIEILNFFRVGSPGNKILGIIRLQMPTKLVEAHEQYKNKMTQSSYRMFHGTRTAKICSPQKFVNKKHPIFCKFGCGVCGIAQEGNRRKHSNHGGRMWFADSSATSLSYCSDGNVKGMFVVDVVAPYPNSILIIDQDEATIPRYLIIYK